jgi:hypothetical protein
MPDVNLAMFEACLVLLGADLVPRDARHVASDADGPARLAGPGETTRPVAPRRLERPFSANHVVDV